MCIRNRENRPGFSSKPYWLVIERPVHHVVVSSLSQEIQRIVALRNVRRQPTHWRPSFRVPDPLCRLGNTRLFLREVHVGLTFAIGSSVSHNLVPPAAESCNQLRTIIV